MHSSTLLRATLLFLAPLATGALLSAGAPSGTPAPTNLSEASFPRIQADGRVAFRLKTPGAKEVKLEGGAGLVQTPLGMERDETGVWSVVTPPAVPGFHYYWFTVDGLRVNDPSSATFFGWGRDTSGLEIPEPGADFYDAKPGVPHGEVRQRWYFSQLTGKWRRAHVYTPPSYESSRRTRFPVLYLQHGAGENERSWVEQGRANFILDNLIAAGRAQPMIVVFDCGYAAYASTNGVSTFLRTAGSTAAFEEVLLTELIPLIDSTYRTRPHRTHRAMAGLSMGGAQTLQISLRHLDTFAWIGVMSGAARSPLDVRTSYGGVFTNSARFNRQVRLLWLGAGTAEADFHRRTQETHQALTQAGIRSVFFSSSNTDHEWQTWRRSLHDFAPRLFKP